MSDAQRVAALRQRGYKIDGAYADAQGRLFTIVSGHGVQRCAIFPLEVQQLADGRATLADLLAKVRTGHDVMGVWCRA